MTSVLSVGRGFLLSLHDLSEGKERIGRLSVFVTSFGENEYITFLILALLIRSLLAKHLNIYFSIMHSDW